MPKTYLVQQFPQEDAQVPQLEIPTNQIFDNYDDAIDCLLSLVRQEWPEFDKQRPRREIPLVVSTRDYRYEIWVAHTPENYPSTTH